MKSVIDLWANFLMNEKLVPERMQDFRIMQLIELCEALAKKDSPKLNMHKDKLASRRLVCETAMDLGIDLPSIKHKVTGKFIIARGLLDAWNLAYKERHGTTAGTASAKEAIRRNVVTKLFK